jgi:hypothetical protein
MTECPKICITFFLLSGLKLYVEINNNGVIDYLIITKLFRKLIKNKLGLNGNIMNYTFIQGTNIIDENFNRVLPAQTINLNNITVVISEKESSDKYRCYFAIDERIMFKRYGAYYRERIFNFMFYLDIT